MRNTSYILLGIIALCLSCSKNDDAGDVLFNNTLEAITTGINFETGTVIACASGSDTENEVIAYVYPRPGVTNIQYFETDSVNVDNAVFLNYKEVDVSTENFFNGYLKKITRTVATEKWVIIGFTENDTLQLSNPIRLKHKSQNTGFTSDVNVDQSQLGMPVFNWEGIVHPLDEIYFQVLSDTSNELLSGTYTFDSNFQYYNLQNVVLNITEEAPPELQNGDSYKFTLMGVSEDNWVNTFAEKSFVLE